MKIVVLDGYTENPGDLSWEKLGRLGELTVYDRTDSSQIVSRIADAQIVCTNKTPVTRQTLEACGNIQFINVLATGFNVVDVDAARERGIPVSNVPAYGSEAVGQFAIAMLLAICHRVEHHSDAVHQGRWSACQDFCFWDTPQIELSGKTMGIIGFGRIGRVTGRIARALGMRVLACDAYPCAEGKAIASYASMKEVLHSSDVVALHCPLTKATHGLINRETIAQMKDGAILLNNSRGALIVEEDLASALNCGKLYAAGLDVVEEEPIRADSPLLLARNCLMTPHISWAAKESRQRLMEIAVNNVEGFLQGRPQTVVNG